MFGYFFPAKKEQATFHEDKKEEKKAVSLPHLPFQISAADRLGDLSFKLLLQDLCEKLNASAQTLEVKEMSSGETTCVNYYTFPLSLKMEKSEIKKTPYHVFSVTKDSNKDAGVDIPSLSDVIKSFMQKYPENKSRLLFPLHQCDRYLDWPLPFRHHMVIVEVDLEQKKYIVHDPQPKYFSLMYRTVPIDAALNFDSEWINYGKQTDSILCGYYGFLYVFNILLEGHSKSCHDVNMYLSTSLPQPVNLKYAFISGAWEALASRSLPAVVSSEEEDGDYVLIKVTPSVAKPR